jgi:hypothetical protein
MLSVERCDPGQMIRAALMTPEMIASEDVFVLWAMRLPLDIDAANAAALLLHEYRDLAPSGPTQEKLRSLLTEASHHPIEQLDQLINARRHERLN